MWEIGGCCLATTGPAGPSKMWVSSELIWEHILRLLRDRHSLPPHCDQQKDLQGRESRGCKAGQGSWGRGSRQGQGTSRRDSEGLSGGNCRAPPETHRCKEVPRSRTPCREERGPLSTHRVFFPQHCECSFPTSRQGKSLALLSLEREQPRKANKAAAGPCLNPGLRGRDNEQDKRSSEHAQSGPLQDPSHAQD